MAKDQERKLARIMYVEQGKTAKEIAERLNVSENTVGKWIADGGWKEQRTAHLSQPDQLVNSLKELLNSLAEKRIEMNKNSNVEPKEKVALSDEISKISKALEAAQKETRIPLSTYLKVMDSIFQALQRKHPKLYLQLIDFQDDHISNIAKQYD